MVKKEKRTTDPNKKPHSELLVGLQFLFKRGKTVFLALLNYSSECGDSDFPRICIDIISRLLNRSFCVEDAVGQETNHKILLLWRTMLKKKVCEQKKFFASQNELIEQLKQYLADYTNFSPTRYFELYVPADSTCFKEEELLHEENSKLCITYSVMSDELAMIMPAPEDVSQVVEEIEKICLCYEKNFNAKEVQPRKDITESYWLAE